MREEGESGRRTVDGSDLLDLVHAHLQQTLGDACSGIGDENIELAEIFGDFVHGIVDTLRVGNLHLVRFGLDAVFFPQLVGTGNCCVIAVIPEGDVCARLHHCFGYREPDSV